jgi:hypothetical protein
MTPPGERDLAVLVESAQTVPYALAGNAAVGRRLSVVRLFPPDTDPDLSQSTASILPR